MPDVHLLVISEEAPGAVVEQGAYEEAVMADARKRVSDFRLVRKDSISGGALFDYTARSKGLDLEYYRSAFADGPRAFQVIAFGAPERMATARASSSR